MEDELIKRRTCKVVNCDQPAAVRGYCRAHYQRFLRRNILTKTYREPGSWPCSLHAKVGWDTYDRLQQTAERRKVSIAQIVREILTKEGY